MGPLEWYHYINYEIADPRFKDWTSVGSPIPLTLITIAYLYFVLKCGPKYMENRPAYSLRTIIRIFNIFQIISNAAIVYLTLDNGWFRDYFFNCSEFDVSPTPRNMQFATLMWLAICLKIIDYSETVLYVLRKKKAQVSFLHLYHHVTTPYIMWLNLKYLFTGFTMTFPLVNCAVHVIMYTYYLLTAMGPKIRKLVHPGKRIVTIIQMGQFVFLIIQALIVFYPGCRNLRVAAGTMLVNLVINFVLFYRFYRENYVRKTKQE